MGKIYTKYELALDFERSSYFLPAYVLFKECLADRNFDQGDVLFHCAWCIEHISGTDKRRSVSYYLLSAKLAEDTVCKMNSYFRAGWVLRHMDENTEALNSFSKVIEIGHSKGFFNSIYIDALYWFAVTLESENKFLDAIKIYRAIAGLSDELNPECRYREMLCLITVGKYIEAIDVCSSFESPCPKSFSSDRYNELRELAMHEKSILKYLYNYRVN